jgi:phosphatidylserine decarboxylase
MGHLASLPLPSVFLLPIIRAFAKRFGANLEEVSEDLTSFKSFQDFFTRHIDLSRRPMDADPHHLVSPCDGELTAAGFIDAKMALLVKGQSHSIERFVDDCALAHELEGGSFCTIYLAPKDYHRFHAPCDLKLTAVKRIPGTLWPVAPWAISEVTELFGQNERVVMVFEADAVPGKRCALVAVGAMMVGKIGLALDAKGDVIQNLPRSFKKGEELGYFAFGSTLVLLTPGHVIEWDSGLIGKPLKLFSRLGRFLS